METIAPEVGTRKVSRRSVARGAARAVPAIIASRPAPAFAVSVNCPSGCPSMAYSGNNLTGAVGNGWTLASSGSFSQVVGNQRVRYQSNYNPSDGNNITCGFPRGDSAGYTGSLDNVILVEADPTAAGASVTAAKGICLTAGTTYTFTYRWNAYSINARTAYLQARIVNTAGTVVGSIGTQVVATAQQGNLEGTRTGSFTPSVSDNFTFQFYWTFADTPAFNSACNRYANDIAAQEPTISCA